MSARLFPIMPSPHYVRVMEVTNAMREAGSVFLVVGLPWEMIQPHAAQAQHNHSQTLERLAERGGLSAEEALNVIEGRPYGHSFTAREANARLVAMVTEFQGEPGVTGKGEGK